MATKVKAPPTPLPKHTYRNAEGYLYRWYTCYTKGCERFQIPVEVQALHLSQWVVWWHNVHCWGCGHEMSIDFDRSSEHIRANDQGGMDLDDMVVITILLILIFARLGEIESVLRQILAAS